MPNVAIADTGAAAASLLNGLKAAANQQATLKQKQKDDTEAAAQRDFQNQLEMMKLGATQAPDAGSTMGQATPGTIVQSQGRTLRQADPASDAPASGGPRKGQTIQNPQGGGSWYVPTKDELAAEDPRNFVPSGQLAAMLSAAGRDPSKPISPTDSHNILQSLQLAQASLPKDEPYHIDTSGKFRDAQGRPAPVMIGDKTGTVRLLNFEGDQPMQPGDKTPRGGVGAFDLQKQGEIPPGTELPMNGKATPKAGATSFALPDKTPKAAKSLHWVENKNDKGDVTMRGFDPETGELKSTTVAKGIDQTHRDPNAPPKEKPPSPAQLRLIVTAKTKALKAANDAYAKAVAPIGGAGGVPVSDQDIAAAGVAMRKAHQQAQLDYEEGIAALTGNEIPHNDWADKALAEAEQPAAKQTPPKTTVKPAQQAAQPVAAPVAAPAPPKAKAAPSPPPPEVTKGLVPGTHTFGNGQTWKKGADGSMVYVSGGN